MQIEYIRSGDWLDRESGHSVISTWWGLVHICGWRPGETWLEFVWNEALYRRVYDRRYDIRWHGRLAWNFARDIAAQACQRQPAPQMPAPDWSTAPEWAQWWAVDADGQALWFAEQPAVNGSEWFPGDEAYESSDGWDVDGGITDIPLGVDWRQTLQRRPVQQS
jgi:hypothetical protein